MEIAFSLVFYLGSFFPLSVSILYFKRPQFTMNLQRIIKLLSTTEYETRVASFFFRPKIPMGSTLFQPGLLFLETFSHGLSYNVYCPILMATNVAHHYFGLQSFLITLPPKHSPLVPQK